MKITKLTTFLVPPRWCFLKIETDEGLVGWGEPVLEGRAASVAAVVDELADLLIGKDPFLIEDHWTVLYRAGFYRGGGLHMSALAGIDQRSEERRVGKECRRLCRSRWSPNSPTI
jgi:galactonate dehydratase